MTLKKIYESFANREFWSIYELVAIIIGHNMKILKSFFFGLIFLTLKVYGQSPVDITFYLKNGQVSNAAKDFYNGKFRASDDDKTLSILDSLNTDNDLTRPFYIYLASKMMDKSDGALAEELANCCNEFMENNPDQAIEFLYSSEKIVDKKFIDNWALQIAGEFKIKCEGKEKNVYASLCSKR